MNELLTALLLSLPLASAPVDERIVCVPRIDGSGWDCGKGTQAPPPRAMPESRTSNAQSEPPPLYLIDPEQMPKIVRDSLERGDYATAEAASQHLPPAPRVVRSADEPDPVPAVAPQAAAAPVSPRPAAPTPAPAAAPRPAPAPVQAKAAPAPPAAIAESPAPPAAQPVAAVESAPPAAPPVAATESAPPPAPPAVATESAPPVAPPAAAIESTPPTAPAAAPAATASPADAPAARPARIISSSARDATELLALPATSYTIQLTAARSFQGFAAFRQDLGVAVEDTFVIRVSRSGQDWWLMLWRDFPDLNSARDAAATLPKRGQFWPRRLAPLQAEARAAQ